MTSTTQARQARLADLLSGAERQVAHRIEQALGRSGVTLEQWRVLCCLSDGAGHPMSEIARRALVPPPTLTKHVDRMTERGLVYRRPDDRDRRKVLVFVAARGSRLFSRLDEAVRAEEARITRLLGASSASELQTLLAVVLERLD
jgi:DNA-binding MarR family transcriptional regulator